MFKKLFNEVVNIPFALGTVPAFGLSLVELMGSNGLLSTKGDGKEFVKQQALFGAATGVVLLSAGLAGAPIVAGVAGLALYSFGRKLQGNIGVGMQAVRVLSEKPRL
tara:strand:+ start:91 stop:411 length:321 start_codon:yes stop_codon:yes gene_type:complete